MALTNFPGGVASFGVPLVGAGSLYDMPPSRVWFVCNRSGVTSGDGTSRDRPLASIADAIANISTTIANNSEWIVVLAGHLENVTASNTFSGSVVNTGAMVIPRGTRIIGEGKGTSKPILTFTASSSTIAFAAADCSIENISLQGPQTGTTTVAALVTITAASCHVIACDQQLATSATALCTTGISLAVGANDTKIMDCQTVYATTGTPTSWVSTAGTSAPARVLIARCVVDLPLSATTGGCIDTSAATVGPPLLWNMQSLTLTNRTASSTVAFKGVTGMTGILSDSYLNITNATGGATAINPIGSLHLQQVFGAVVGKNSLAVTPVSG